MGDGSYSSKDGRVRIFTNQYTFDECTILQKSIQNYCGIQCGVLFDRMSSTNHSQYILTIGKKGTNKTSRTCTTIYA